MTARTIERTVRGMKTSDGAGVKLTRVIGTPVLRRVDPFLMLDESARTSRTITSRVCARGQSGFIHH